MLIICPECELQVSDKALTCPHCGYPMKGKAKVNRTTGRKRLPNGFGQISEVKGKNLRNPYRVLIPIGKNSKGKIITKLLKPQGYFRTYNDAYAALVEYNKNPYDLEVDITVKELYEKWSEEYFKTLKNDSSKRTIISSWSYCSSVYDMRAKDIRARHIKGCMDEGSVERKGVIVRPTAGVKSRIKSMFNLMLDYALEYEIVTINYARTFDISDEIIEEQNKAKRSHIAFTEKELKILWDHQDDSKFIRVILFQCYSGWRPQELGLIKLENVDLENDIMIGGMKTKAGKDRIVPIHEKIKDFVKSFYEEAIELGSKYLINCTDTKTHKGNYKLTYDKYAYRYSSIIKLLNLNPEHRPHDPRKQFATMAKKYGVDEYAIKYMIGHEISDLTEKVYTERSNEWLKEEMAKIK